LAWQSYGDAAKQVIATRAPELGWSPGAKQMIASWTLGWTKPPASQEKIAPGTVAPKVPPAPSLDPAQGQQMVQSLATAREAVQEVAARQEQTARDIARLESVVAQILLKIPEPLSQPPAAPARKPPASPSSSRVPTAPPSSLAPMPPLLGSQAWAQEASVEDRACIIKAAAKLPKITGLEITQSRAVPQGHAQGRHDPDLYHVKVEIDVNVAGQRTTYIFNCIHSGEFTVIQPLGMR